VRIKYISNKVKIMKGTLLTILSIIIIGASSCTYRTCPTYTQNKKIEKKIQVEEKQAENQEYSI